jgi:hypothetical protein
MAARGFIGAGDLYINRYNPATAAFEGFKGPFEASKFEIKPNVELKELASRGRSSYGQVIESVPVPQPADFTVELPEVNRETLSLALLGVQSALNQGSGTWTNAPIVVTAKDVWLDLGKRNVTAAGFQVQDATNTTTYVLGTDYEINYAMGWLKIKPASAIAAAATLEVSGAYAAVSGALVKGAIESQIRAQFRLHGKNMADGLPCIVDVFEAVIAADAAFDFLADDFNTVSMPGRMKTPAGKDSPFTIELLDQAV